jgi:tRNA (mo5U34)-methyltransferase
MTTMSKLRKALRPVKQLLTSSRSQAPGTLYVPIEENWLVEPPNPPSREEAERFVKSYSFWYHRVYLGNGIYTMPPTMADRVWALIKPTFPENLKNASILDIGSNAGYFSILAKLRGAGRILGIEFFTMFLQQAEYIRKIWQMDIEYRLMDAHDIVQINEEFDLVMFAGILYHLKNPLMVLEEIGRRCRDAVVVESEIIPEDPRNLLMARLGPLGNIKLTPTTKGFMKFYERDELNGDGSNWWAPDTECLLGMLRVAGFKYFSRPIYHAPSRILLIATKKEESLLDWRKL